MFMSKLKDLPNNFLFPLQSPSPHRARRHHFFIHFENDAVECSGSDSGSAVCSASATLHFVSLPSLRLLLARRSRQIASFGGISALKFQKARELSPRFDGICERRDFRGKKKKKKQREAKGMLVPTLADASGSRRSSA